MRALILEHRQHQHQQLLVCRHLRLKTENKKRDFSYRQRKGEKEERNIFFAEERRVLNFFFFGQNAEKTNAETRERGEARDETG